MINRTEKKLIGYVPHSRRQIMLMPDGEVLQRQNIYMPEDAWNQLRHICLEHGTGSSKVIAKLIKDAHKLYCMDALS